MGAVPAAVLTFGFFAAFGFAEDFAGVVFFDVEVFAAEGFAALAAAGRDEPRVAAPRRSPPIRVGRVAERVPSTPASAFAAFFVFFFPDFSAITRTIWPALAHPRGTVSGRSVRVPRVDFKNIAS